MDVHGEALVLLIMTGVHGGSRDNDGGAWWQL